MPHDSASPATPGSPRLLRGTCTAFFAFDVGFAIDLDQAQSLLAGREGAPQPHRGELKRTGRAPLYFAYQPPPLRVTRSAQPRAVGPASCEAVVQASLWDFGVISVAYRIPLPDQLAGVVTLADALYEHPQLAADARTLVAALLDDIRPAVARAGLAQPFEDYVVFHIEAMDWPQGSCAGLVEAHRDEIARILRAERGPLSAQERDDATSVRVSYRPDDEAVVDWNAALLIGEDMDDARAVLEFANVELLELRFLDDQLDRALAQAYEAVQRPRGPRDLLSHRTAADLRRISSFQVDSALLFEGVNNALKLLGDQYLARLYRAAGQRQHLPDWDSSILRKLGTLESIYDKIADRQSGRRMEALEWIVIGLIAFEILMSLLRMW